MGSVKRLRAGVKMSGENGGIVRAVMGCRMGNLNGAILVLLFAVALLSSGCGEVKPLTPEEQSLVSAWKIGKSLRRAYSKESVDEVVSLLTSSLANRPETRPQLAKMFGMFRKLDLTLVMDSGEVDPTTHSITFRGHWTMTGLPKSGSGPRYFQTGECQIVVSMAKTPNPSRIESISGDTFLAVPAKLSPKT